MITQTQAPERVTPSAPGFELRVFLRALAAPLVITVLVLSGAVAGSSAL
ncbi:MAG: hypothetical protein GWN71_21145, partial [Gammaproteobacteria bacterium]|nr:hypothetical protein [Gemmatimonadota bacterium]NIU75978.1 hypothetical protein [Gammaproteobacteria bacterium]